MADTPISPPPPLYASPALKGTFTLTISVSVELAPTARLLLFAVFADGEVSADVDVFNIEKCLQHQVKLGFSEEEDIPGSKVELQVEAVPGALCSLRAVDKSVTLKAARGFPLTLNDMYRHDRYYDIMYSTGTRGFDYHLEDFEPYPCLPLGDILRQRGKRFLRGAWYESQGDVYSLFKEEGIKLTFQKHRLVPNGTMRDRPAITQVPYLNPLPTMAYSIAEAAPPPRGGNLLEPDIPQPLVSEAKKEEKGKPRTYFPETWIWDLVPLNKKPQIGLKSIYWLELKQVPLLEFIAKTKAFMPDYPNKGCCAPFCEEGRASLSVTSPDTITEWRADAFCVADVGFGMAQPANFRTTKPFFMEMHLPYSMTRGETFELKATVFNYLKDCIQMKIQLAESEEVEVEPCLTCRFTTCLCAEEAQTFSWNVTATQLGRVNLSITTEAEETQELCGNRISVTPAHGRSDTVIKSLLVKPEGILKEETHNAFLCSSGDAVVEDVSLKLPENPVEDSGRATFSVIGDILGPALENVDQLLQMPFGCGEQNMAKLVPNIFILQYLEATNQATPETKAKAAEYMTSGYQRQLLYKHEDGSYSAFGKADTEGNTWLTAFVARAFGQAKSYIYVDAKHVEDAVRWLKQHQRPSGCFESVGRLFNNALKVRMLNQDGAVKTTNNHGNSYSLGKQS
uniref:Uncharacterized protein n=1 Tax=Sphaerodactylus townsendi TaxID=933632 RepID=A0ACB8ET32_9SAUR